MSYVTVGATRAAPPAEVKTPPKVDSTKPVVSESRRRAAQRALLDVQEAADAAAAEAKKEGPSIVKGALILGGAWLGWKWLTRKKRSAA